jgi:bifunctional DNA-binding transcriptional regulator/antitoxin component of YhaV-PrlF toxin-antitoxin module
MNRLLQATSRGQVTLPKGWRDKFNTTYYTVEIKSNELVLKPFSMNKTLKDEVEDSWQGYKDGNFIDGKDLTKKYGL